MAKVNGEANASAALDIAEVELVLDSSSTKARIAQLDHLHFQIEKDGIR
jgi:hypothetical protein